MRSETMNKDSVMKTETMKADITIQFEDGTRIDMKVNDCAYQMVDVRGADARVLNLTAKGIEDLSIKKENAKDRKSP